MEGDPYCNLHFLLPPFKKVGYFSLVKCGEIAQKGPLGTLGRFLLPCEMWGSSSKRTVRDSWRVDFSRVKCGEIPKKDRQGLLKGFLWPLEMWVGSSKRTGRDC